MGKLTFLIGCFTSVMLLFNGTNFLSRDFITSLRTNATHDSAVNLIDVAFDTIPPDEEDYNKCFSVENGYEDFTYIDSIVSKTSKNNYFTKKSISDSSFVWKVGRGDVEYIIDTFPCNKSVDKFFDWETEDFVALIRPCGSYCWTNIIFPMKKKENLIKSSYSAIDKNNMNILSIDSKGNFLIQNLYTRKKTTVKSRYWKLRKEGSPTFFINEVELKNDLIVYKVSLESTSVTDTLIWNMEKVK